MTYNVCHKILLSLNQVQYNEVIADNNLPKDYPPLIVVLSDNTLNRNEEIIVQANVLGITNPNHIHFVKYKTLII